MEMADGSHDDGSQASKDFEVVLSSLRRAPVYDLTGTIAYIYAYANAASRLPQGDMRVYFRHIVSKIEELSNGR